MGGGENAFALEPFLHEMFVFGALREQAHLHPPNSKGGLRVEGRYGEHASLAGALVGDAGQGVAEAEPASAGQGHTLAHEGTQPFKFRRRLSWLRQSQGVAQHFSCGLLEEAAARSAIMPVEPHPCCFGAARLPKLLVDAAQDDPHILLR